MKDCVNQSLEEKARFYCKSQAKIDENIDAIYEDLVKHGFYDKEKVEPIKDGVTNFEEYLSKNNKPRIMWLLKEPYDDVKNGEPFGGGFSIPQVQSDSDFTNHISRSQQRIIYAMQCIRTNGKVRYDDMDWYWDMPQHLQNIAYVNLSKMPSLSTTDNDLIQRAKPWVDIVKKQIELYDPEVIILGNTYAVATQLGIINNATLIDKIDGLVDIYWSIDAKERLLLNAYHPSYYLVNIRAYSESLAMAINKYYI